MIPVAQALDELLKLATRLPTEVVPLGDAAGRVLAEPLAATRNQPPFAASAMDGYAVSGDPETGASFQVIGESAAGHGFAGHVDPGQAVRIFTGAPLPPGTDRVIIQEDVHRDGDTITLQDNLDPKRHVRPAGADFKIGDTVAAGRRLTPADIALIASMNHARVPVVRKPVVAIIATGDELVQPGEDPGPDQIIASNSYGLAALFGEIGAHPRLLPIARDTPEALRTVFRLAEGADLVVTIGGASVGDHDLVGPVARELGLSQSFYKVAMRPGKPLMAGRMGQAAMIGLPGNPVSAMVCGHVFVKPVIHKMLGLATQTETVQRPLLHDIGKNGPRAHYMRGQLTADGVRVFDRQDSALLSVLSQANCLVIRPPHDDAQPAGAQVLVQPLD